MQWVDCTFAQHGQQILAILNHAIVHSTALYDYQPRSMDHMSSWFASKTAGDFPVIGLEESGELLGFATYGTFRQFPAYQYTVEHSLYVHHQHRGHGIGKQLLRALIARAESQQRHLMVGVIDAENQASIALHRQLGFVHSGTITQAGFKFDRWLDVAFYQLMLTTPAHPVTG